MKLPTADKHIKRTVRFEFNDRCAKEMEMYDRFLRRGVMTTAHPRKEVNVTCTLHHITPCGVWIFREITV